MNAATHNQHARGFTLIELVVAISIGAVVVSFMAMFIVGPVNAYQAQARRAELVDATDSVLRLMARDIHAALPNSVRRNRIGSIEAIEMLATIDAGRYRDTDATAAPNRELDFSAADGSFATLGQMIIPSDLATHHYYLSIYNVGVPGADAYELDHVITPTSVNIGITNSGNESLITMTPAFKFSFASPSNRVYLVSGPVTYLCDEAAGTLMRYQDYSIAADQKTLMSDASLMAAGASRGQVADGVSACSFDYYAGTWSRSGLATLALTVRRTPLNSTPEQIRLLHQVHVENVP
jgi:MSHA biogenesis protein MshO